jgi:hypothetical protein
LGFREKFFFPPRISIVLIVRRTESLLLAAQPFELLFLTRRIRIPSTRVILFDAPCRRLTFRLYMPSARHEPELTIAKSTIEVHWNSNVYQLSCKVTLNLARAAAVHILTSSIELEITEEFLAPQLDDAYEIRLRNGHVIEVIPTEISQETVDNGKLDVCWNFVPKLAPVMIDESRPLRYASFFIVNFGTFHVQQLGVPGLKKNRLSLLGGNWSLELCPIGEDVLEDINLAEGQFHRFTHAARLAKGDDTDFTCEEAHAALDAITKFLSFCRGRWVAPAIVRGFDAQGALAMQEWGTRGIEPYTRCATWVDRMQAQEISKAFPGFMSKAFDPDWQEAVNVSIY